jgi:hypothetical protein
MRYYYDDPLAAAWMADKFGMVFRHYTYLVTGFCNIYDGDPAPFGTVFYIHPDSLDLLEPMVGDLMRGSNNKAAMYYMGDTQPKPTAHIVQRNGLAFMWPREEA